MKNGMTPCVVHKNVSRYRYASEIPAISCNLDKLMVYCRVMVRAVIMSVLYLNTAGYLAEYTV